MPKIRLVVLSVLIVFFFSSCGDENRPLVFPFDHGPHFNARTEWWYFTGDAESADGKRFGFECTIFKGRADQNGEFGFIGHVAVSDPDQSQHFFSETASSTTANSIEEGKADIQIDNFSYVYLEDEGFKIQGKGDTVSVAFDLVPEKPVLLHGSDGVITMGDGLSSYYYSCTNLSTTGTITLNGIDYSIVSGRTWMDHQWGNFSIFGLLWDWFSLRFDDGGALMLFRFRDVSGKTVRSNWSYRSADDETTYGEAFNMQASRTYKDETGKCSYPLDWQIEVPGLDQAFTVKPLFDAQTLYSSMLPDYWEGLCSFTGSDAEDTPLSGSAYVELTGYCRGW